MAEIKTGYLGLNLTSEEDAEKILVKDWRFSIDGYGNVLDKNLSNMQLIDRGCEDLNKRLKEAKTQISSVIENIGNLEEILTQATTILKRINGE